MANKIKGITIEIGGDTQKLTKALEGVNKQSRDLQGELKQVERLLKLDPKNTELLAQKQELLSKAISNTKEKLETLKEAERQVQQQFERGEVGEEQYRAIQREVIQTEQQLKNLEQQLKNTNNSWKEAAENLEKFGKKSTEIGKNMTTKVTAPIVAVGAASFKMAADIQDAVGATEQIYKDAANAVKEWADSLDPAYGIAEGEALEYANMMGSLLQNIGGLTEEEAAKQAQTLVQLAGDLTAMFGGTTEDAIRALTGALKGNTAMLDNYGIACNDALIKAKALEMGIYDGKGAMDLSAKQAAILALIMEQTGAAQGQAARESEGASGSMRTFTTEIKNLATDIGETLLPIITPFIQKLTDIVKAFDNLSPGTQKVILVLAGLAAAIGPLLIIVGQMSLGLSSIIKLFGGFSTATAGATAAASGAAGATGGLSAVIGALTGPIGIAIAAIAAITAVIVHLWKTNEEFRENVKAIWEQIKEIFSVAMDAIRATVTDIYNAIKKFWEQNSEQIKDITDAIWNTIAGIFNSVMEIIQGILDVFIGLFTGNWERFGQGLKTIWEGLWNGIKAIIDGIFNVIKNLVQIFINFVSSKWEGLGNFLQNVWDIVWGTIQAVIDSATQVVKGIFDVFAGLFTRDWERMGEGIKNIWQGMWNGIKAIVEGAWKYLSTAFTFLWDSISGWFSNLAKSAVNWGKNLIDGFIDGIKSMINKVKNAVTSVVNTVSDYLGFHSPAKKGEGRYIVEWGQNMIEGFMEGMQKALPELQMSAKAVMPAIKNEIINTTQIDYSRIPKGDTIIHVYNPQPSPSELARQIKKTQQELALGF